METSESGENAATNLKFSKLDALLASLISSAGCGNGETISTIPHICVLRLIDIAVVINDCMQ